MRILTLLILCVMLTGCSTFMVQQDRLSDYISRRGNLTGLSLEQVEQMFGKPYDYSGYLKDGEITETLWYVFGDLKEGTLPKNQLLMIRLQNKKVVKFVYY